MLGKNGNTFVFDKAHLFIVSNKCNIVFYSAAHRQNIWHKNHVCNFKILNRNFFIQS